MSKTAFVSGVNGFVGRHVVREFKNRGYSVIGSGHDNAPNNSVSDLIDSYVKLDLLNIVPERIFDFKRIDAIVHLAGLASVSQSFEEPQRFLTGNGLMTYNLLSALHASAFNGRVVVISTGALYDPQQPLPIPEQGGILPNSPYAAGKILAENVTEYFIHRGLDAIIARPFNHIGPGQSTGFLLPDLYDQLISIDEAKKLYVGNIDTKRDYTDVRDIARAYVDLCEKKKLTQSVYNICSGRSISGRDIASILLQKMKLDDIQIIVDKKRVRPTDIQNIYGDNSLIRNDIGWKPLINIEETIFDFVNQQSR